MEKVEDRLAVYRLHMNGPITNVHDQQAAAIADVDLLTGGESPTEAEFNALATKFNALLRAVRSGTGVGILAAS